MVLLKLTQFILGFIVRDWLEIGGICGLNSALCNKSNRNKLIFVIRIKSARFYHSIRNFHAKIWRVNFSSEQHHNWNVTDRLLISSMNVERLRFVDFRTNLESHKFEYSFINKNISLAQYLLKVNKCYLGMSRTLYAYVQPNLLDANKGFGAVKFHCGVYLGEVLFTDTEHDGFRWVQNGYGSVFLNEGEHYTGNWRYGKLFDAQGTFTAPNGDVYNGGYKNDMKQGQGELTCANGALFIGEWHEAQRVNGRNKYSNGEIYQGQFKNDLRHGHGILYRSDGKTPQYIGEWENDLKSGMGEFTYSNGDTHIGVWRNGRENGQGSRAYKCGDIYIGEFRNGYRQNIGCMTYRNGHIYDGSWVDDHPHGRGTMYYPGGDFYDGMWVKGVRQGKGTMKYATGFTYSGDWEDNVRHGVGQHVTPKGYLLYDGRWKRDVKCGFNKTDYDHVWG